MLTIKDIENSNLLIYKFIRGSHAFGLNKENSDIDYGGVYLNNTDSILGFGDNFPDEVKDEKGDATYYSLKKFMHLLMNSNPNALEALFVPERCIIVCKPEMQDILKYRDSFISKDCFNSYLGYSLTQIKRARGLNKKCVNPITERKNILDFCYVFEGQGSIPLKEYLNKHHLEQRFCGLTNIPNMRDVYGLYYDYAANSNWYATHQELIDRCLYSEMDVDNYRKVCKMVDNNECFGYKGIVNPDDIEKSNEVRLSSIPKGEKPLTHMYFNKDAYTIHCKEYREYKIWEKERNPERFKENQGKTFDRKNVMHCVRLLHMGLEIAKTGKINVDRTNIDKDFLMNIRLGNTTYEEIISYIEEKREELEDAIKNSVVTREHADKDIADKILIKINFNIINNGYNWAEKEDNRRFI